MVLQFLKLQAGKLPQNCIYRISSYNCRGNYSFLNSSSEETIQGEETNQGRKLYEEIRYIPVMHECPAPALLQTSLVMMG